MYSASTTSTTSGSAVTRGPALSERRVRVVRLMRSRRTCPSFGFSLRGGREHSTGFFISKVEVNSEAQHQGLKVGDQLVSVNGYRVDDAVHSELVHYLATQSRLKIKVRNVGMIPVKDKCHEPLSWQFISDRTSLCSAASSSPTLCHDTQTLHELRLSILVPPKAKLGCGICKGPEWKPGIFVQFVRENGIAREAGLRPGDQILACNGQDFSNITFNDAIAAMKVTGRLELLIREGAGIELVSPESSGYNSSASSAAGERSPAPPVTTNTVLAPPAALRRRLASVAEEAADRVDRLTMNKAKRKTWDSLDYDWKNVHHFDTPSDIEPDYDSPSIPNNPHSYENQVKGMKKKEFVSNPSNRTIINLTENGATIECSYDNPRKSTYSSSQYQSNREEKKMIVVEVHHSNGNKNRCKNSELTDSSSISSSTTLSSAIAEEILKRKLKKKEKNANAENEPTLNVIKKNIIKPVENEKKKQHDALMDEFKKVHRKMFSHQEQRDDANQEQTENNCDALLATDADRQPTLPLRKPNCMKTNGDIATVKKNNDAPPPPPPMPVSNGATNGYNKSTNNFIKIDKDLTDNRTNGTIKRIPTPDYSNKITNTTVNAKKATKDEAAELESLESFKLNNPASVQPKPPSNYFVRAPNGTATMKKHARPVSVTIGEYPSGGFRKEPSKLDFIANEKVNGVDTTDSVPITNRLQSELALTLSRSNLRKKTDAIDKKITNNTSKMQETNDNVSCDSLDKNFHLRYGNNILPLPPSVTIPKVKGIKHMQLQNKIYNSTGD